MIKYEGSEVKNEDVPMQLLFKCLSVRGRFFETCVQE